MEYYQGHIFRAKVYPIALSGKQILRYYRREWSWLGRLLNDIEHEWICFKFENPILLKVFCIVMAIEALISTLWLILGGNR